MIENLKPYKKGETGNPKGSTRKKRIPDMLRKIGDAAAPGQSDTRFVQLMNNVWSMALSGDRWAIDFIANRTEGTAPLRFETTTETKPIAVFFCDYNEEDLKELRPASHEDEDIIDVEPVREETEGKP